MQLLALVPILALAAAPAHADVLVVDDDGGPGVDFVEIRAAVQSWEGNERVAVVASGGLSHFVIDEDLDNTVTAGIVSAMGRTSRNLSYLNTFAAFIQTDAAINPGNSGGPLLDSSGRLIGVNTQIYSPSGASAGIGFAIPVDMVNRVVPDLIEYGRINRPILGIDGVAVTYRPARGDRRQRAVLIETVTPGLGADRAGLRPHSRMRGDEIGDLIVAIEGQPIESMDDLLLSLEQYTPGDAVTVTVLRNDRRVDVEVELSSYRAARGR